MLSENQTNPGLNNKNPNFVDKLISFRGLLKIMLFFSIQLSVLVYQMSLLFYGGFNLSNENFWDYNIPFLIQVIINYTGFLAILLFIFAFYLGKELKLRNKERFVLFSFKGFLFGAIFLAINGFFIYYSIYFYYFAQMGYEFNIYPKEFFVSVPFLIMIWFWIIIGFFWIAFKIISSFIALITKKPHILPVVTNMPSQSVQSNQISTTLTQENYQNPVVSQVQQPQVMQSKTQQATVKGPTMPTFVNNQSNGLSSVKKDDRILTKDEIRQMQVELANKNKKGSRFEQDNVQENIDNDQNINQPARTPKAIINYLENHLLSRSIFEQGIIFFVISQFIWLTLFTFNLYSDIGLDFSTYNYPIISSLIGSYAVGEFIYYAVISLIYYDILKNHFKNPHIDSRNKSLYLLAIGTGLIVVSLMISSSFTFQYVSYFIILKAFILLLIPAFYFGYKSQNQTTTKDVNKITKMNPVFNYFYNKSLSELRDNEKSAEIIKKFLQTHKEDIRKSLISATPLNFKQNIREVIIGDYPRLETLLSYNGVHIKSKVAIVDYTMEVFSTFLINIEVNLQDVYTEHLLKSNQDNLLKPISSDFIESKFSKLFSQWESLDWTTQ